MRVVDTIEMRELENKSYNTYGFNEDLIIENVGIHGALWIEDKILSNHQFSEIVCLVGKGNNGSDSLAIARFLQNRGYRVRAFILFPGEGTQELNKQLNLAEKYGVKISEIKSVEQISSYFTQTQEKYLVIDGILGTGFRVPLSNFLFEIINIINEYASITVSVDIPSGIMGDAGEISSTAVKADYTLAIALPKTGHFVGHGPFHSGEIFSLESGMPREILEGGDKRLLLPHTVAPFFLNRDKFAHKNRFGHVLLVGGSKGLTGALKLASEAALKSGAGLVTAATWPDAYNELTYRIIPEIMTGTIPLGHNDKEYENILRDLGKYSALVIGPGLGKSHKARDITLEVLNNFQGPVVLDADAIGSLSLEKDAGILSKRKGMTVLTPHVGEFSKFIKCPKENILKNPLEMLKSTIEQTNCAIVLKSSCSFVGLPSGEIFINYFPNDGMATGGSGDVLAGIIGGILAQVNMEKVTGKSFYDQNPLFEAICGSVLIHSLSGKHAAQNLGSRSMTAGAIIDHLPESFKEIENN